MHHLLTTLLAATISTAAYGQTCLHTGLSKKYTFKTSLQRPTPGAEDELITVTLSITDKTTDKQTQQIVVRTGYLFDSTFENCNAVRSYTTGLNKNTAEMDNDYGDLVVADLNFDDREDIALKKDSGGNGGPVYNFYIQDKNGQFRLDPFLTEQMTYFPTHILKENRTLITMVHANAYQMGEHTYKLDVKSHQWKQVRHRLLKYN